MFDDYTFRLIRKDCIVDITETLKANLKAFKAEMAGRQCGDCTACCWVLGIKELAKAPRKFCKHQGVGCGIHPTKPPSCQEFRCLWLDGNIIEEELRPDRLGAMFCLRLHPSIHPTQEIVSVFEIVDGALDRNEVGVAAKYFAMHYPVILMHKSGRRQMLGPEPLLRPIHDRIKFEAERLGVTVSKLLEW